MCYPYFYNSLLEVERHYEYHLPLKHMLLLLS
ncbi:hypothetical protein XNC1_1130 [Xenorhabdus nematophila ATCC 19061]|uniref:Uncharacterized protein n=1 Tax=Xenorhabdus nematophila (strain ATCC 19061 / DSM 3370 / CCUG 14189 / LMG 1036 / NCIMB 9965 / AN6) TaxID=406817 RepID=D3V903_XENNA|nr:hypothetical protein XNC1_1130 [Xenorhabdus nematophila ATCC 19061]